MKIASLAFAIACTSIASVAPVAADPASPAPAAVASDPCAWLAAADVTAIVGVSVAAADVTSRRSGICFFPSQLVSEEASASYAVVTPTSLAARRKFFAVAARRCGAVSSTQHAGTCAAFVALARAADLDAYYAARTAGSDARPVDGLALPAIVANGVLYARGARRVFEIVVRRDGEPDDARTRLLASAVFARAGSDAGP